jgi:hypothetical protein
MHPTWVEVGKSFLYQSSDHKGSFHLIAKCKNCLRENSLGAYDLVRYFFDRVNLSEPIIFSEIIENSAKSYTQNHSGTFSPLIEFDCRGMELVDFEPRVRNIEIEN